MKRFILSFFAHLNLLGDYWNSFYIYKKSPGTPSETLINDRRETQTLKKEISGDWAKIGQDIGRVFDKITTKIGKRNY